MNKRSAISKINKQGILLVFPINNKKEPNSLWREFYPRKKMIWDWNEDAGDNVANLWILMKKLSDCKEVVYSKWYQGRATFFSREVFTALVCLMKKKVAETPLSQTAQQIYDILVEDSPLSTKQLKAMTDLQGKYLESTYKKGCDELFKRFMIVAFGEVDDGAFPSLAVGATRNLFEDLWLEAREMPQVKAQAILEKYLPQGSLFRKFFDKVIA